MTAPGRAPLLVADGDIATTRILAGVLRSGFGDVEVRALDDVFGAEVDDRPVLFCRVCHPAFSWLPDYFAERGLRYAYFLDDNFWEITPDIDPHVASFFGHPATVAALDRFVRGASAAIVWAPRLGRYIADRFPEARVECLPAAFDLDFVAPLLERAASAAGKPPGVVRVGYPTTRRPGIAPLVVPAIRDVAARYGGRVEFEFVGWMPDELGEVPHVTLHPQIVDYRGFLEYKISRQWDIGLAPMTGGLFEACKTNNKYREYGGCRVAGMYSAASPYVECVRHGETGLLVENDPGAWTAALVALIEDPPLRAAIAERAFEDVRRNYNQAASARSLRELLARLAS